MSSETDRAESIALEALDLPAEAREALILENCPRGSALETAVRQLVRDAEEAESYFRGVAARSGVLLEGSTPGEMQEPEMPLPESIGPYRILESLGHGGMGTVYLGERVDPDFRMRVAVKLLHPYLTAAPFLERFLSERRILAGLSHPGIAALVDGGVAEDGRPYIAMQYVEGEDIVTWADRRALGLDERIRLFLQVCDAVSYAHQKLVVHRDLKPSNTRVTAEGTVKLLDFGIARVLDPDEAGDLTRLNPASGIPLTPGYASPEQVRGETIGTASDVFSMGLLLWKLLCGETPMESKSGASRADVLARDPMEVRPATYFARSADRSEIATSRGTSAPALERALRGDIEAILRKALRPVPDERYGSVHDLAEDLRRFLDGLPVRARAGSTRYRVRKFAGRHRWGVAAVLTIVTATVIGVTGLVTHSARLELERDRAALEALRAEAATDFLIDLFDVAGDGGARDTIPAGVLLQAGEERLRQRLGDHPSIQSGLLRALAHANVRLGLSDAQIRLLEERVQVLQDHFGENDMEVARALQDLGSARNAQDHWNGAENAFQTSLAIQRGHAASGRQTRADSVLMARTLGSLAIPLRHQGLTDSAIVVAREGMARQTSLAVSDMDVLDGIHAFAYALRGADRLREAETLYREILENLGRVDGPMESTARERLRARVLNNLASLIRPDGRVEEAEQLFRQALEIERDLSGPESAGVERILTNIRTLLVADGRIAEAEALATRWRELMLATHPPDHWRVGRAFVNVGDVWLQSGRCELGIADLEEGARIYATALGPNHSWTATAMLRVSECLISAGQDARAEALLTEAIPHLLSSPEPIIDAIQTAVDLLSGIYLSSGRPDAADELRSRSPAAVLLKDASRH